jgi:hypothetical protein
LLAKCLIFVRPKRWCGGEKQAAMILKVKTKIFSTSQTWDAGESADGMRRETETSVSVLYTLLVSKVDGEIKHYSKWGSTVEPQSEKALLKENKAEKSVKAIHAATDPNLSYDNSFRELFIDTKGGKCSPYYEIVLGGNGVENPALLEIVLKLVSL